MPTRIPAAPARRLPARIPTGILAGSLLAGAAGILVGIPSLRLSGVYLAIATLGFGEVLRAVLINWESLTGGAVGIAAIPQMGRVILAWAGDRGFSPQSLGLQNNQFISLTVFLILLPVSYTHLRAHETRHDLVIRLLLEKKKSTRKFFTKTP